MKLTAATIREGVWQAVLAAGGDTPPAIEVVHAEAALPGLTVAPVPGMPGQWALRLPIPAAVLADGVQTFLIRPTGQPEVLGHFSIVTGVPLEDDLRAEIDLLRAELDMLKRAFRRHCLETTG